MNNNFQSIIDFKIFTHWVMMMVGALWCGLSSVWGAVESEARSVRVEMKAESIVDMRPFDQSPWGFWQFPVVTRFPDGRVLATFSNHKDLAALNHILGPVFRYEADKNEWIPEPTVLANELSAVVLPDGERIMNLRVEGPDSRKLKLPKSCVVQRIGAIIPIMMPVRFPYCRPIGGFLSDALKVVSGLTHGRMRRVRLRFPGNRVACGRIS
ncbi:MAG: hypothetical protein HQK65_09090 [Desulfamplus sp.]|nr:hypothetical protein [Desulfamplus sp.]